MIETSHRADASADRRRTVRRRRSVVAAFALALGTGAVAIASLPGESKASVVAGAETQEAAPPDVREDGPSPPPDPVAPRAFTEVVVHVSAPGLAVTAGEPALAANADVWFTHTVVVSNDSAEPLVVDWPREAAIVESVAGQPALLVADALCGYGTGPGGEVMPGCRAVRIAPVTIAPGQSVALEISVWRDLRGFAELAEGTYQLDKTIRVGPSPEALEPAVASFTYQATGG